MTNIPTRIQHTGVDHFQRSIWWSSVSDMTWEALLQDNGRQQRAGKGRSLQV